jgi:hypothetical protein
MRMAYCRTSTDLSRHRSFSVCITRLHSYSIFPSTFPRLSASYQISPTETKEMLSSFVFRRNCEISGRRSRVVSGSSTLRYYCIISSRIWKAVLTYPPSLRSAHILSMSMTLMNPTYWNSCPLFWSRRRTKEREVCSVSGNFALTISWMGCRRLYCHRL